MNDIARRFPQNPLLSPADLQASREGLHIACLLNPGVFKFDNKIMANSTGCRAARAISGSCVFPGIDSDGRNTNYGNSLK